MWCISLDNGIRRWYEKHRRSPDCNGVFGFPQFFQTSHKTSHIESKHWGTELIIWSHLKWTTRHKWLRYAAYEMWLKWPDFHYYITYDNLTLSEVIGRFFLPRYPAGSETRFYINDTLYIMQQLFYISCNNFFLRTFPDSPSWFYSPYDLYRIRRHPYRSVRAYISLYRQMSGWFRYPYVRLMDLWAEFWPVKSVLSCIWRFMACHGWLLWYKPADIASYREKHPLSCRFQDMSFYSPLYW